MRVKNLGLIPEPAWEGLLLESVVDGPHYMSIPQKTIDELPKRVCPNCGHNHGLSKTDCKQCGIKISKTGTISLRDRADGLSPKVIGSFYQLAMQPIKKETALEVLGRNKMRSFRLKF